MKPGRELDVLVAEKVMGWRLLVGELGDRQWLPGDHRHPDSNIYGIEPPHYSTDIAAAWQVVEMLSDFQISINRTFGGIYAVAILERVDPLRVSVKCDANGDTASHAICLAALKAVGEEL